MNPDSLVDEEPPEPCVGCGAHSVQIHEGEDWVSEEEISMAILLEIFLIFESFILFIYEDSQITDPNRAEVIIKVSIYLKMSFLFIFLYYIIILLIILPYFYYKNKA
jgi:hypothetical protein